MLTAIRAETLFDGISDQLLPHRTVVVEGTQIQGVAEDNPALPEGSRQLDTPILAPGFIDMQINGASDLLFNDAPTAETIAAIAAGGRRGGSAYILPTFITAEGQAYRQAMSAAHDARIQEIPGVLGLHLEGPFLSPKRPGIHDRSAIRHIGADDLDMLTSPGGGVRLITLAPEEQPDGTIERLSDAGWKVFAGHSEATVDQMIRAADAGLRGVTHLFNAMSQITPREPGVVGSALSDRGLFAGMIADGHHVHPTNLRLAVSCLGSDRLFLVTDAMPTLGGGNRSFKLDGKTIHLVDGRLVDAEGTLAGAHLSMIEAVRNMIRLADLSLVDALRMASTTAAKALGLEDELGRVKPGCRAGFTLLNDGLDVRGVVVDGRVFE